MASTVLASQVSSFALVGQTLTFDSNQGGIIGFFLDIINSLIRGFNSVTGDTVEIDETEYDGSGSGSGMGESLEDDYFVLDGSGDEQEQGECTAVLAIISTLDIQLQEPKQEVSWSRFHC